MSAALVLLIVVPLVSAILCAALGQARAPAVRWAALGSTIVSLVLSFNVVGEYAGERYEKTPKPLAKFEPYYQTKIDVVQLEKESVRPNTPPGAIRFYIGLD